MIKPPVMAGHFYPEGKKELADLISKFLKQSRPPVVRGEIFGLLLPHASYLFSGSVAAHGFQAIAGKVFDTIILIGDSHYERFEGVSIWQVGFWQTPLGKVEIDKKLAQKFLSTSKRFFQRDSAHLFEHSLEVHLPFLQKTLKNFKILPIIFGSENKDWRALARVILKNIKNRKVLIIASSDLSHGLSFKKAKIRDKLTLKNILNLKTENLEACSPDSVKTLVQIARRLKLKPRLLKYKFKKVGYAAVIFAKSGQTSSLAAFTLLQNPILLPPFLLSLFFLKLPAEFVQSLLQQARCPAAGKKNN